MHAFRLNSLDALGTHKADGSWEFTAALTAWHGIPRTHIKLIWLEEHHAEPPAIVNVKGPGTQIGQILNLHHVFFFFLSSVLNLTSIRKYRWDSPCYERSSRLRLVITGDKRPAALCICIVCIVWPKMRLHIYDHRFRGNFLLWASLHGFLCRYSIASLRSIRDSKILESLAQMPGGALCFWTPGAATKSVERQIICMAEYGFLDRFEWVYGILVYLYLNLCIFYTYADILAVSWQWAGWHRRRKLWFL